MDKIDISLGDLLHPEQRKMLTVPAQQLSRKELSAMQQDPSLGGKLSEEDRSSIIKLAMHRANNGQTVFTFSEMHFDTDNQGDPGHSNW